MTSAAIYARYSTDMQSPETIKTQIERCRDYCKKERLSVVATYTDEAKSRRTEDRDGYQQMIQAALDGQFGVIVVYRYDRFGGDFLTNLQRLAELKQYDIEVWSASEGKDILMRNISIALSQRESEVMGQRVRDGMIGAVRRNHKHMGVAPYGYFKKDGKLEIDPDMAPIIRALFRLALDGNGQMRIANALNDLGHKTRTGREWRTTHVAAILKNPAYTGALTWNKTQKKKTPTGQRLTKKPQDEWVWVENTHEAYISKDDWQYIQKRMAQENGKPTGILPGKYILTGFMVCGYCGKNYTRTYAQRRRGRYVCQTTRHQPRNHCPDSPHIVADEIENLVLKVVLNEVLDRATMKAHLDRERQRQRSQPEKEKKDLERALTTSQQALNNLVDGFKKMGHSETLAKAINEEEQKQARIIRALKNIAPIELPTQKDVDRIREEYAEYLQNGTVGQIRRVLAELNCSMVVKQDGVYMQAYMPFHKLEPLEITLFI